MSAAWSMATWASVRLIGILRAAALRYSPWERPGGSWCVRPGHQHGGIVAAARVIAHQQPGQQHRVQAHEAGIRIERPARADAVGVHDQETFAARVFERLDLARVVAGGALERDHAPDL